MDEVKFRTFLEKKTYSDGKHYTLNLKCRLLGDSFCICNEV